MNATISSCGCFQIGQKVRQYVGATHREKVYEVVEIRLLPTGNRCAIGMDAKGQRSWLYAHLIPGNVMA